MRQLYSYAASKLAISPMTVMETLSDQDTQAGDQPPVDWETKFLVISCNQDIVDPDTSISTVFKFLWKRSSQPLELSVSLLFSPFENQSKN